MAIVVFGGGIAGLWVFNRLILAGYDAYLVEKNTADSQTLKCQGILHGGFKYELEGIRAMPSRWQACMRGEGEIDLRTLPVLSRQVQIFPTLNTIDEMVVDVRGLLEILSAPYRSRILQEPPRGEFKSIWAAGAGNEWLTPIQRRPLHQVLLEWEKEYPVYVHEIGHGERPALTITTLGKTWHLGGDLAESGVSLSSSEQIKRAQQKLSQLFPSMDFSHAKFSSFLIDRIEPKSMDGSPQRTPFVKKIKDSIVVFPGKLVFAPLVGDLLMQQCQEF